ncbi:hypothetical protein BVH74_17405 [Halopseudomonas phragmitis]|uniref:RND transporter n=1 Tax=Halopseudomonas phragmitis TaxID=1931241 RepID=A0A1V0B956_9GAMM|nr:hypothetical protein BVH74_17405 [Halopseudomonas phragmitis]
MATCPPTRRRTLTLWWLSVRIKPTFLKPTLITAALALSGCAINAPLPDAQIAAPTQWSQPADQSSWPTSATWDSYGSAELQALLQRARTNNLDLASAASRLVQADAQLRQTGASLLPQASGGLGTTRSDSSRTDANGDSSRTSYSANLNVSYEVDFWGRNRNLVESARASLDASRFDYSTLMLSIEASVANTWFQQLETERRLLLARENLAAAERVLELVEARYRYGAADSLELSQQRTLVTQQRASLPSLEQQQLALRNAMALLLGEAPDAELPVPGDLQSLQFPAIEAGLPAELLQRRPDIRASESRLVAANADLGAARAALYPSIQLTGQYGAQSLALSTLVNNPVTSWSLAAGLTQPIFQGGRLRAQVTQAEARQEELLIDYQRSILSAFGEVDTALGALRQAQVRHDYLAQATEEAELAFRLAETRYRAGAITLQTLLDTQRTLFQSQDSLAQQRSAWLQASVDLFRVLGGGWAETSDS